jgi:DNA-binding IclR family transcriptional regulator
MRGSTKKSHLDHPFMKRVLSMPDKHELNRKLPRMDPAHKESHSGARGSMTSSTSTTVAKAINIVEILASRADLGITLAELSSLIKMPKSSTHRYLGTLQELGLAERKDGDRYCLGAKVIEIAGSFLAKSDLRNESQVVMNELAKKTGETIHLAVPSAKEIVYIAKIESPHALGMSSHIGSRLPMYCTSLGKAILAFSDSDLLEAVLSDDLKARTSHTKTSPPALRADLATIRAQGFALDDEENEPGIRCVGAPVLDYSGKAFAAISISGPCERITLERAMELGPLVWESTRRVSKRWGYSA